MKREGIEKGDTQRQVQQDECMTPTPDKSPLIQKLERLEQDAVDIIKEMGRRLGSEDANDSGPAICAVWNLGTASRRLALIIEQAELRLRQAGLILIAFALSVSLAPARPAVEVELPATDGYCVSVVDRDGQILGRIDLRADNAKKQGREVTREKVKKAIRGLALSALVNQPDVAAAAENIILWGEPLPATEGVICSCATLQCAAEVCGVNCNGPCHNCLLCKSHGSRQHRK